MKIKFISPIDKKSDLLFDTFVPTFIAQGHSITECVKEADVVFFDLYSKLGGGYNIDDYNGVYNKGLPFIIFDATDYGAMSRELWAWDEEFGAPLVYNNNVSWRYFFQSVPMRSKIIYFVRKMDKTLTYPEWVYPYELIQYPDHDFTPVSKDELFNRGFDITFIANTSPTRENVINGLLDSGKFKMCTSLGKERLPHDEWLNLHRNSKLFLTSDGGGFSDERPYQLISISPMLRQKNNHLQSNPLTDLWSCIEVEEHPTENDIKKISYVLKDADILFDIYRKGILHLKEFYNAEYRANYILDILKQNGIC